MQGGPCRSWQSARGSSEDGEAEAALHRATAAQKQQQIEELEEWAQLFGDPVKQSAQAKVLEHT